VSLKNGTNWTQVHLQVLKFNPLTPAAVSVHWPMIIACMFLCCCVNCLPDSCPNVAHFSWPVAAILWGGSGVLDPSLSGSEQDVQMYMNVPCCYTQCHRLQSTSVLPSVAELCLHADCTSPGSTLNINVDFKRLFDCINCIKMFGSGWAGSARTSWRVHEMEGKKGGLKEGERWSGRPRFMTDLRHFPWQQWGTEEGPWNATPS